MSSSLRKTFAIVAVTAFFAVTAPLAIANSPWGANYFPNVELTTDKGTQVRFFDDLIENKIVSINFIYTTCVDTCPLETAQLVKVQKILGERLGKDVFFYSISIDPEHDTPEVLTEYKDRFGANWTFLTGKSEDITTLRRKLGLYVEEIQDGSNNHNVNMIIGNQTTGRWMKRSPFENPHVLADQIGNWLDGWKSAPVGDSYANAPKLRTIPPGEQLFRTRCATCHTVDGNEPDGALGPDLLGVVQKREKEWLINWLRAPDQMLANKDPIALSLFAQYNNLTMPNMRLNQQEAMDLLDYINDETLRLSSLRDDSSDFRETAVVAQQPVAIGDDVVGIMNAWVRETDSAAKANAGYMTLINIAADDVTLVDLHSDAFEDIEMHEMAMEGGMMAMREVADLVIPRNGQAQFAPGGWHLMLKGPRDHLITGQTVDMTLTFASGQQQEISVKVAAR